MLNIMKSHTCREAGSESHGSSWMISGKTAGLQYIWEDRTVSTILKGALGALILSLSSITAIQAASISGQGTWETTLLGRDLDGNATTAEAYYDTVLGITWLADANYAQTSGYDVDGLLNWAAATAWATSLNPYSSGIMGWRLPETNPVDGSTYDYEFKFDGTSDRGYNISAPGTTDAGSTGSELAHMFYNTLGNKTYYDTSGSGPQTGWGLTNEGPFDDSIVSGTYWSGTEYAPRTNLAWYFNTYYVYQLDDYKTDSRYAWAVHSGDVGVSVVPIPAAVWLFGSGLMGLLGVSKWRRRRSLGDSGDLAL